jgi:Tol biopolymer transport system component
MPRLRRSVLSRLLALAVPLAFGACDSAESPLSPAEDPLAPSAEPASTEAVSPDNAAALATSQRITFISYRKGSADVYKVDPQGNNLAPLTSSADEDYAPTWSYDNKRIAMVRYRLDGNVGHSDIWIINADGSNGHWARPTPSPWDLMDPSWSPDGSRLVLSVIVGGYWYLGWMELPTGLIHLINPASGGIVGTRPSYDRTGQRIIYVGSHFNTVEQINADGSGRKIRLTANAAVDHPTFSPDGKKIAFEKGAIPGNTDIFVKNLVTGVTKRLTFATAADRNASWSPDGTRIAFMSERSGKAQVWTMNATTGGSLVRITDNTAYERFPSWSH